MKKVRFIIPILILVTLFSFVSCEKISEIRSWEPEKKKAVSGTIDSLTDSVRDISNLTEDSSGGEIVDATTGVVTSLTKLFMDLF